MAMKEAAAMTGASGLTGDETRIHQAADTVRQVAQEIVEELPVHARALIPSAS
jgi:hypothetical protein